MPIELPQPHCRISAEVCSVRLISSCSAGDGFPKTKQLLAGFPFLDTAQPGDEAAIKHTLRVPCSCQTGTDDVTLSHGHRAEPSPGQPLQLHPHGHSGSCLNLKAQVQSLSSIGSTGSPVPPGAQGGQFQHRDSSEKSPAPLGRAVVEPDRGSPASGKVKLFPARLSGR